MTTLTVHERNMLAHALHVLRYDIARGTVTAYTVDETHALQDRLDEFVIEVGDYVRSHDFPERVADPKYLSCYIEGTVESIEMGRTCMEYRINVKKQVWAGREDPVTHSFANAPINGTPTTFGELTHGVELVKKGGIPDVC